jgi:hypothetical protein
MDYNITTSVARHGHGLGCDHDDHDIITGNLNDVWHQHDDESSMIMPRLSLSMNVVVAITGCRYMLNARQSDDSADDTTALC